MKLSSIQQRFIWRLITGSEPISFSDAGKLGIQPRDREDLNRLGLIAWEKRGASSYISALDQAWSWANENLDQINFPKPAAGKGSIEVLERLTRAFGHALQQRGVKLAEVLAEHPPEQNLEARVEQAYLKITNGRWGERAKFRELAAQIPDVSLREIHQLAKSLQGSRLWWSPIDNPRERTPEDDAAALWLGNNRVDLIRMQKGSN